MYSCADLKKGLKLIIDGAPHVIAAFDFTKPRITSYNVCYTKLLRYPVVTDSLQTVWRLIRSCQTQTGLPIRIGNPVTTTRFALPTYRETGSKNHKSLFFTQPRSHMQPSYVTRSRPPGS